MAVALPSPAFGLDSMVPYGVKVVHSEGESSREVSPGSSPGGPSSPIAKSAAKAFATTHVPEHSTMPLISLTAAERHASVEANETKLPTAHCVKKLDSKEPEANQLVLTLAKGHFALKVDEAGDVLVKTQQAGTSMWFPLFMFTNIDGTFKDSSDTFSMASNKKTVKVSLSHERDDADDFEVLPLQMRKDGQYVRFQTDRLAHHAVYTSTLVSPTVQALNAKYNKPKVDCAATSFKEALEKRVAYSLHQRLIFPLDMAVVRARARANLTLT